MIVPGLVCSECGEPVRMVLEVTEPEVDRVRPVLPPEGRDGATVLTWRVSQLCGVGFRCDNGHELHRAAAP